MATDKQKQSEEETRGPEKGTLRDYLETIATVLIFVLFARTWIFQNSKIPTGSMENTLLVGDRLLVNSFVYGPHAFKWEEKLLPFRSIRRGDVVVFKYPLQPAVPYIKRVVAKGGDVVQVINNRFYLNGVPMKEDFVNLPDEIKYGPAAPVELPEIIPEYPCFLHDKNQFVQPQNLLSGAEWMPRDIAGGFGFLGNFGPYRIPEGHLFVMGDNRNNSQDSRFWGVLDEGLVLGKAWVIWWSYEEDRNTHLNTGLGDHLRRIGDKIIHFFSKTRWERCFDPIR